jgi:hypothetical protein
MKTPSGLLPLRHDNRAKCSAVVDKRGMVHAGSLIMQVRDDKDAQLHAYIVAACNAYPELVAALRAACSTQLGAYESANARSEGRALLAKLEA